MLPAPIIAALATRKGKWIAALALVLLVTGAGSTGYYYGWQHKSNAVAAAQLDEERAVTRQLAAALADNTRLERDLAAARSDKQVIYRTIEKEVPRVVTKYIEQPGDEPRDLPECPVTRGFVGLWDDALFGRMPAAAGLAPGAPAAGDADHAIAAGIGRRELLENHVVNAQTCDAIRAQLNALIDWHEQQLQRQAE